VTWARLVWLAASLAFLAALILFWQFIADNRYVSPVFLPGPDRAWGALMQAITKGDLLARWIATVERMIIGWLLASLVGIVLGAVIGSSERARAYIGPTLELMRPLPASAVVPLAIALLGLSEPMVLAVIAFGALWPMLLATVHGFANVEIRLYEVSRVLGLSRSAVIFKISLPSSMPDILSGMRLSLTVALILTVVGEMLAGRDGLGSYIMLAARAFRSPDLFAGVILLGITGLVSAVVLGWFENLLLRWRSTL
jgi:ABC-type nitrate/sulfonate/bicarbonate transport system permease component